jgi:hypothetical protein
LPLTEWLSVYGRFALSFGLGRYDETSGRDVNRLRDTVATASWSIHAMLHASRHFFVGVGPRLLHAIAHDDQYDGSNRATRLGVGALIGGWL